MGKMKMKVTIKFYGGPMDKLEMDVEQIDEVRIFVDKRSKIVLAYRRWEDHLAYVYDGKASVGLTKEFDNVMKRFGSKIAQYPIRSAKNAAANPKDAT